MYLGDGTEEGIEDFEMDLNGTEENPFSDRSTPTSPLSNGHTQDKILRDKNSTRNRRNGQKTKENTFYCPNCSKIFPSRAEIEDHIVPCAEKRAETEQMHVIQNENAAITPTEDATEYNCDRCLSKFTKRQNYSHHLRLCPIPYRLPTKKKPPSSGQEANKKTFKFHCKRCRIGFDREVNFKLHQTGWFSK